MGIGNLLKSGVAAKAEWDWQSGDPEKQRKAIKTWMGFVGDGNKDGSQLAVDHLHELARAGVTEAARALSQAYEKLAKKAAKDEDIYWASFLVTEANDGWGQATRAIDQLLNERGARKGKEKDIRNYKVYAQAGYAPAIALLTELGVEY